MSGCCDECSEVICDPDCSRFISREYERLCNTPSDIFLHLPRLAALVEMLDAQHVIELGTRSGVSTIAFLHALETTGGRLTSIDIDAAPPIEHERWTFIRGDDLDPFVVSQLDSAELVFVDTSHFYEHTLAELHVYRHLVKPGGVIACHDTQLPRPEGAPPFPTYPVRRAIEAFCGDEHARWTEYPECWGLGVIHLP